MPVREPSFPYHLTLDGRSQYSLFKKHLLTDCQLTENNFPKEHPLFPGKIHISRNTRFNTWKEDRTCARCNTPYLNNSNPAHCKVKPCYYHSKKFDNQSQMYPCCNATLFRSPGCTLGKHHVSSECNLKVLSFKKTRPGYNKFPCNVFALDCEMVYTTCGLELAKVGIVDVHGKKVYESFVRPEMEILDYNTEYSGISWYDLGFAAIPFSQAQEAVLKLINEDSILVGHGLDNDLRALRLIHKNVVDTSVLFPNIRTNRKRSLKDLAKEYLNKYIQIATRGHDCKEDARTVMELMLHKINTDYLKSTQGIWVATNNVSDADSAAQGENSLKLRGTSPQANPLIALGSPDPRVQSMSLPQYLHKGQRDVHRPVDAAKVSFRHGTREPGVFVQDENDCNFVNTSSRSRRSPDLNSRYEGSGGLPEQMQEFSFRNNLDRLALLNWNIMAKNILGQALSLSIPPEPSFWTQDGRTWYPDPLSIPPNWGMVHH